MATEVKLPRLGQGMESGTIVRWLKAEGDAVKKREPLYELDTDKVTQEVEAETDGVLLKIVVAEGEVEVGTTVAVIGKEGEDVALEPATASAAPAAPAEQAPDRAGEEAQPVEESEGQEAEESEEQKAEASDGLKAEASAESDAAALEPAPAGSVPEHRGQSPSGTVPEQSPSGRAGGRVKASPLARRIARERGIDLAGVTPTGPEGRILAEDVQHASPGAQPPAIGAPAPPAEIEVVALTSIRKTIARRLTEAWAAPVFQLGVSADTTEVLALRESLVARLAEGDAKPTVNDVIVKLAAVALARHTPVNAVFTGEEIQRHASAHVGIAVAAPQGLVVPVIRSAERLTIQEIARARADLVGRARDNKLTLGDLEGGTFTISNLGMFGVEQFTAVINPPQVAILAVGAVKDEAVVVDGELDVAPIVRMTLTCDHRAIDGADGARFLQTLVGLVEQPALAL